MKLISWNLASRLRRIPQQVVMLEGSYAGLTHPWQMARHRFNTSNRQWPLCCAAQAYVEATLEEWLWPSPPLAISRPSIPGGL